MGEWNKVLVAAVMVTVGLAGCTSDGGDVAPVDNVNPDDYELAAGTGAIAGLLLDDRFRPVQLTDDPKTEFQARGFILVQETGAQIQTTENGEFTVVDLEPGTYTLRLTADGYEAAPQQVAVEEAVFNEVSFQARRISSEGDIIITQEHAAFASCFTNFVMLSVTLDCTGDRSGDTDRAAWYPNLEEFNSSLHYVVLEVLFDRDAPPTTAYDAVARDASIGIGSDFSACLLTDADGPYCKLHLPIDRESPDPWISGGGCDASPSGPDGFCPYNTSMPLQVIIFGRGYGYQEVKDAYKPVNDVIVGVVGCPAGGVVPVPNCLHEATMRRGAGGALATKATYMMSLFLFDPEEDPSEPPLHERDYCVLCQ